MHSYSGCTNLILTLMRVFCVLVLEKGLFNPNMVVFDTTLRACGITVRGFMPLLFLAHYVMLVLGLGLA